MISGHKKIHGIVGAALVIASALAVLILPPNIAPEFSGSALLRLEFDEEKDLALVEEAAREFGKETAVERMGEKEYAFTAPALSDEEYAEMREDITGRIGTHTVLEYQSFSPSISQELARKSMIAILIAVLGIIIYIACVFRGVSRPIESWKYGVAATVALMHDTIIPLGVFAVLSPFTGATLDTLFVTALLATMGYSINDTIVIFDRIRDRLRINQGRKRKESFSEVTDAGVRDSVRRSVYTSASTIVPLALLFAFVPVTRWFAAALFVGIIAGTYSSLCIAPSLLLLWHEYFPQKEKKERKLTETEQAEEALRRSFRGEDSM